MGQPAAMAAPTPPPRRRHRCLERHRPRARPQFADHGFDLVVRRGRRARAAEDLAAAAGGALQVDLATPAASRSVGPALERRRDAVAGGSGPVERTLTTPDVAASGVEALMDGDERVVAASLTTKLQGRGSRFMPDRAKAAMHRRMAEPGRRWGRRRRRRRGGDAR